MTAPAHITHIVDTMLAACPYCKAAPLTPCQGEGRTPLRYTHAERNRT